jgi:hypothetical protein
VLEFPREMILFRCSSCIGVWNRPVSGYGRAVAPISASFAISSSCDFLGRVMVALDISELTETYACLEN